MYIHGCEAEDELKYDDGRSWDPLEIEAVAGLKRERGRERCRLDYERYDIVLTAM
jgi:hypothetical protein